jgi:hypothetical protein
MQSVRIIHAIVIAALAAPAASCGGYHSAMEQRYAGSISLRIVNGYAIPPCSFFLVKGGSSSRGESWITGKDSIFEHGRIAGGASREFKVARGTTRCRTPAARRMPRRPAETARWSPSQRPGRRFRASTRRSRSNSQSSCSSIRPAPPPPPSRCVSTGRRPRAAPRGAPQMLGRTRAATACSRARTYRRRTGRSPHKIRRAGDGRGAGGDRSAVAL